MAGFTLDTGALIAAERQDRRIWKIAIAAARAGQTLTVPAPALAQVWRGKRSARLSLFLRGCDIEPLDETLAKHAGVLCGLAGTTDIVDAAVIAGAARRGDDVVTGDPEDMRTLTIFVRGVGVRDLNDAP